MTSIKIVLSVLFIVIATSFIDAQTVDKKGGPGSQETVTQTPSINRRECVNVWKDIRNSCVRN